MNLVKLWNEHVPTSCHLQCSMVVDDYFLSWSVVELLLHNSRIVWKIKKIASCQAVEHFACFPEICYLEC
nr:hypothetical protein Itr_chr06CG10270 [Ipomoea trifida]